MTIYEVVMQRARALHGDRLALNGLLLAAYLLFWCCTAAAPGAVSGFVTIIGVVLLVVLLLDPYQPTGLLVLVVGVWLWYVSTEDPTTWWSLPAGLCLLAAHAAQSLIASAPDSAPVPREVRRLWQRRYGVVAVLTGLLAVVVLALATRPGDHQWWSVLGLVVVAAGVLAVATLVAPTSGDAEHGGR
ncbi:hypothetical protein [Luteipulveratus flavus]|uniref:Integral membrane protein n=1 Tax=Luteipulveratus flavus TaxID=3031728 RepID=A0ABT6CDJ9_9MICO|nr:hypothetical protein [Luteipulveratus sp. YIM 133296]MDF8265361.1 hypothetical protein [Luteipulveratus sp. YIM 133296]